MAEQLLNSGFTTSSTNNPDDWTVVEPSENTIHASGGTVSLKTGEGSDAYIEQTVTNVDVSQPATLSFTYFNSSIVADGYDELTVSIYDDQGTLTNTWTCQVFASFSETFTPPSPDFTVRFECTSQGVQADFPVYITDPSLDATESINPIVPCFGKGTLIQTPLGLQKIEDLQIGDLVETVDNGAKPILWIGHSELTPNQILEHPNLAPVHISAGALGKGLPETDLIVSPQHRILVRSKIAQRMFDTSEVLIPAIKLVGLPGIKQNLTPKAISYYHILFDQHEVVVSNGAHTESLYTGKQALKAVGPAAFREITTLFPEIMNPEYVPPQARYIPKGKMMKQLTERHAKNNKPLVLS